MLLAGGNKPSQLRTARAPSCSNVNPTGKLWCDGSPESPGRAPNSCIMARSNPWTQRHLCAPAPDSERLLCVVGASIDRSTCLPRGALSGLPARYPAPVSCPCPVLRNPIRMETIYYQVLAFAENFPIPAILALGRPAVAGLPSRLLAIIFFDTPWGYVFDSKSFRINKTNKKSRSKKCDFVIQNGGFEVLTAPRSQVFRLCRRPGRAAEHQPRLFLSRACCTSP